MKKMEITIMKKRNIIIGVVILATIVGLFLYYQRMINVFDEDTIVSMTVTSSDGLTTNFYTLDQKQLKMLSTNLKSAMTTDLSKEGGHQFKLTLLNKWDISQHYSLYMHENGDILIQDEKKEDVKFLTTALFFKSHEAFDTYYENNYFPELTVKLGNEAYPYNLQNHQWFFRRLNNQWVQKNTSFKPLEIEMVESKSPLDEVYIFSNKPVDKGTFTVTNAETGIEVNSGTTTDVLPVPEYNGVYKYVVDLEWLGEKAPYKGTATLEFNLTVKQPPRFTLRQNVVEQGQLLYIDAINVEKIEDILVDQSLSDKAQWFYANGIYTFVIPTDYSTATGEQTLKISNTTNEVNEEFVINIQERTFKTQQLSVNPNIESEKRTQEAYDEYNNVFLPKLQTSSSEKYYDDNAFVVPAKGRITTEFGEMRSVNGALTTYRHNGIDIGAKQGTPVLAVNKGKVVLAKEMILTGNTIIIDHGHGLISFYEHLYSINVAEGDMVESGAEIGQVGTTGFSTGPHLHFSLSFFDFELEPGYLLKGEAITKEKYPTIE